MFVAPVRLRQSNGNLSGSAGRTPFIGLLFPEGEFQLFSAGEERHFTVRGQHLQPQSTFDELRGDVSYGAGDECTGGWQFVGRRQ